MASAAERSVTNIPIADVNEASQIRAFPPRYSSAVGKAVRYRYAEGRSRHRQAGGRPARHPSRSADSQPRKQPAYTTPQHGETPAECIAPPATPTCGRRRLLQRGSSTTCSRSAPATPPAVGSNANTQPCEKQRGFVRSASSELHHFLLPAERPQMWPANGGPCCGRRNASMSLLSPKLSDRLGSITFSEPCGLSKPNAIRRSLPGRACSHGLAGL